MARKKTAEADKGPKEWVIRNGKYPQYLTGIVENDREGVMYCYATDNMLKAMRFTEAEAKETAAKCHGKAAWLGKEAKA